MFLPIIQFYLCDAIMIARDDYTFFPDALASVVQMSSDIGWPQWTRMV
jgi:hypothetical protein